MSSDPVSGTARATRPVLDREALVRRHNVVQTSFEERSPVSVGNGEFAFTVDLTGLQTVPQLYPVGGTGERPGTLLGTQAQWGWHSVPPAGNYSLADSTVLYDTPDGRRVPYVDMVGGIAGNAEEGSADGELWLRANPHRLDLGRIGFSRGGPGGTRALQPAEIKAARQDLDLWTGVVNSSFILGADPVEVTTACHPDRDELGIRVASAALAGGLGITVAFPYGSEVWYDAADWEHPDAHSTVVEPGGDGWLVRRELDGSGYDVRITGAGLQLEQVGRHEFRLTTGGAELDVTIHFVSTGRGECTLRGGPDYAEKTAAVAGTGTEAVTEAMTAAVTAADVVRASAAAWREFWNSGGAIELSSTADPRAQELERRIVLSQYLTAVNCAGSLPPQETGLVCNSWRGRFHLEMHWWHGAHFAAWNRSGLLLPSLRWYSSILPASKARAADQGYDGARWPKQVGPDGRESPSPIGTFLIWQQPHPIYLAELAYRAEPSRKLLEEFADIIFETAQFMASFAYRTERGFELGWPLIPAQESYADIRGRVSNPTFELAYWQWALRTASAWWQRLGREPVPAWQEVADAMVKPHIRDGVYSAIDVEPFTIREDHPSMLCALGFLPQTDLIDPDVMRSTLHDVLADWDWASTWGWDYPVLAMTAARLGDPETAVDALLLEAGKNAALANGHNRQTDQLPLYLPGNGGLLAAAALMAAGWDGGPDGHAPGFPPHWSVQWDGLVQAP